MSDENVRSLEYLRGLSRLHEDWRNDSACVCCDWAVLEIEQLRGLLDTAVDAFESGCVVEKLRVHRCGFPDLVSGTVSRDWLAKAKEVLGDE